MARELDLPRIDWASAEATRGTVTVWLAGAQPRGRGSTVLADRSITRTRQDFAQR